jgi:hypothetical protein
MGANDKKKQQLGMAIGTASARLRKMILFELVRRLKLDVCFRCGKLIETVGNLSIEHKEPWLDVSVDLFWDLENIAFSHLSCNVASARKPHQKYFDKAERQEADRRLDAAVHRNNYTSEKRRQKYLTKGY